MSTQSSTPTPGSGSEAVVKNTNHKIVLKPLRVLLNIGIIVAIHVVASLTSIAAFPQLVLNSLTCIYIGCFLSSKVQVSQGLQKEKQKGKLQRYVNEQDDKMKQKDAYMFPVIGSCVLFSLYVLYKFFDKYYLNLAFSFYFALIGIFSVTKMFESIIDSLFKTKLSETYVIKTKIDKILFIKDLSIEITHLQGIIASVALFPCIMYFITRGWIANNIIGIAFSIFGIQSLALPNFQIGFILLWGLFFYDIFWVYGTDVMVTVAQSLDAPIKLIFPYDYSSDPVKSSMLGLGDIVIPGIFVALCLKYDIDRYIGTTQSIHQIKTPYFNTCFIGYIIGIITTFVVMVVFNHAQPALLFLVPGCTFSVLGYAFFTQDIQNLFSYQERPDETLTDAAAAAAENQKNDVKTD